MVLSGFAWVNSAAAQQAADGAQIFQRSCATCHNGAADSRAPALDALRARSAQAIVESLLTGAMRPQGARLSGAERRAVAEFLTGTTIAGDVARRRDGTLPGGPFAGRGRADRAGPAGARSTDNTRFQPADQRRPDRRRRAAAARCKWAFGFPDASVGVGAADSRRRPRVRRQPERHRLRARRAAPAASAGRSPRRAACARRSRSTGAATAGVVYFGDTAANVYALDAETGRAAVGAHGRRSPAGARSPDRRRCTRADSTCRSRRTKKRRAPIRSTPAARSAAACRARRDDRRRRSGRRYTIPDEPQRARHEHRRRAALGTVGRRRSGRRRRSTRARGAALRRHGQRLQRARRSRSSNAVVALDLDNRQRCAGSRQVTPGDVYVIELPAGQSELPRDQRPGPRFRQPADAGANGGGPRSDRDRTEVRRRLRARSRQERRDRLAVPRRPRRRARRHRVGIGGGRRARLLRRVGHHACRSPAACTR